MKKIAIVYGAYDGMHSHYCGVGTMTKDFMLSFKDVVNLLNNSEERIRLLPICVKNTDFAISTETCCQIENTINENREIYESITWIDNGKNGKDPYGNVENWINICEQVVDYLQKVSREYDNVVFIGLDGPYLGCAQMFCKKHRVIENVHFVNILYSSVLYNRELPFSKSSNYSRLGWEIAAMDFYKKNMHKNLIYANSKSFGIFMKKNFNLDTELPFVANGLSFSRMALAVKKQKDIEKKLAEYSIPTDKQLMFTVGRCDVVKGFEYVIKLAEVLKEGNVHTVILMSQCEQNPLYYHKIKELSDKDYITLIDKRDMNLPAYMYQWCKTRVVAALAKKESAGLIPTESRFYHNSNCIIVVSDIEGLSEQIEDGVDGYITRLLDCDIEAIGNRILKMTEEERALMSEKGYHKVQKQYNAVINYKNFLAEVKNKFKI